MHETGGILLNDRTEPLKSEMLLTLSTNYVNKKILSQYKTLAIQDHLVTSQKWIG